MTEARIEAIGREEWLSLSAQFHDRNYRQSWDYGLLLAQRRKAASRHVKIQRAGRTLGLADVRIKRLPLLGGLAYISGGPLVRKGGDDDIESLGTCLEALCRHFVDQEGMVLRVQGTLGDPIWNREATNCFLAHGFVLAGFGRSYRTLAVDLSPSLDDIRAQFASNWRNHLKQSERKNPTPLVTTRIEDFDRFVALFDTFVGRKGFDVDLGADFYRQVQNVSESTEQFLLTVVEENGSLMAGHVASMLGDTCVYLLGATAKESLKTSAAYLLQWNVIKRAKERGILWYDLGGIDPVENPGVYSFKSGLGGLEMTAPGPFERSPRTLRSRLVLRAESVYRRLRQSHNLVPRSPA
jgi:hypothetical protein